MTELLEIPFRFENEQIILSLAVSKTYRLLLRRPFQTLHDRRYGGKSSSRHRR